MTVSDSIISYREPGANSSCFLSVNTLLQKESVEQILSVYKNLLLHISCFEPSAIESMAAIEKRFYTRLMELGASAEIREIRALFEKQITHIRQSLLPKEEVQPIKALQELQQRRKSGLHAELKRLIQNPRIAKVLLPLKASKRHIFESEPKVRLSKRELVAVGQSIELQERLRESHYVFNHGQNGVITLLHMFAKQLKKTFEPAQYAHFEVLRHDVETQDASDLQWYITHMGRRAITREDGSKKGLDDWTHAHHLISCDGFLESVEEGESAFYFFVTEGQTKDRIKAVRALKKMLMDYFPQSHIQALIQKIDAVVSKVENMNIIWQKAELRRALNQKIETALSDFLGFSIDFLHQRGTIYSICVPKDKFHEMGYISEPFGLSMKEDHFQPGFIDRIQNGENPNSLVVSSNRRWYESIQVRLLASKLDPKEGVFIVPFSTIPQKNMDMLEEKIARWIQRMRFMPETF